MNILESNKLINEDYSNLNINVLDLGMILDKECIINKKESWGKLDKTNKLTKLKIFTKKLTKKHNLTEIENDDLDRYLKGHLEKKNLLKVKDVLYDINTEEIKSIPLLTFNNTTRKFVLKKDKHVSTTKSLTPRKSKIMGLNN